MLQFFPMYFQATQVYIHVHVGLDYNLLHGWSCCQPMDELSRENFLSSVTAVLYMSVEGWIIFQGVGTLLHGLYIMNSMCGPIRALFYAVFVRKMVSIENRSF